MLENISIIALTIYAIWQTFQEGHILHGVALFLEKRLPVIVHKPVFLCHICMTFWYGLVFCLLLGLDVWLPVPAMGLVAVLTNLMPDEELPD